MKTKVIAKAILLDEHGKVLLLRRSKTDFTRPGERDFPGGKIEPGEDICAGAVREILEETGLSVPANQLRLLYSATNDYGDLNVIRFLFAARITTAPIQLSFEHDDSRWITPAQAAKDFPHPFYGVGLQYAIDHKLLDF